jgi:hypothetical protein
LLNPFAKLQSAFSASARAWKYSFYTSPFLAL